MVAGATSTLLGNRWRSPKSSGGSEAPPHLFFTWRSYWGSELLGCALLLGRDDVAVQDDFFCQQPVSRRRQMDIVFVREGSYFTCFFGERVVHSCEDAKDVSYSEVGCFWVDKCFCDGVPLPDVFCEHFGRMVWWWCVWCMMFSGTASSEHEDVENWSWWVAAKLKGQSLPYWAAPLPFVTKIYCIY